MAMEALGRLFNVAPIVGAGVALSLRDAAAVTFVCTGADTFTLTTSATFGGSYATPGSIITHYYQSTATDGTAGWTKQAQSASNAVVQSGAYITVIEVMTAALSNLTYIKCTASSGGKVMALVHDLEAQRKPANLPKLSA